MSTLAYFMRPAQKEDVETIYQLSVDLATHEKEPESVKSTPELLRQNLFESTYAHVILALSGSPEAPGETIGFALYFFDFSTRTGRPGLYVGDVYVKPEYRGKGIGKAFFAELAKIAHGKNCARMDWSVVKWNQSSIDFYEKGLSANTMTDWVSMRLEEDQISRLIKPPV